MGPYDYTLNVKQPFESALQGYNAGINMQAAQLANQERQLAIQQQQQAAMQQAQMRSDLSELSRNPNASAKDYSAMMTKYPQLSDHFKKSWDVLNASQQQSRLTQASELYATLLNGKPELAEKSLDEKLEAAKNSGDPQSIASIQAMRDLVKMDPQAAKTSAAIMLSAVMGPDKFAESFSKLQSEQRAQELQPSILTKSQADAQKAAVAARFAESDAVMELEKKGWDIKKIQEDIKIQKYNSQIAAMNAQTARQGNTLKAQELQVKIQELQQKRDAEVRAKVADASAARSAVDNFLNTADKVLQTPISVVESATGPISSRLPTLSSDTADFEALVSGLSSQAFLSQVATLKSMGNLSDAEGKKLEQGLGNLSLKQSSTQLINNVKEIQRIMLKARTNISTRYGVPDTVPDTPAVQTSGGDVDSLLQKYGVK